MSRAGYSDDCYDTWALIRWRGAVSSVINGKRGQAFLIELLAALDAMPEKKLITEELKHDGCFCTLGVIGNARGLDMYQIDPYDTLAVAKTFNVAEALSREIAFQNDEGSWHKETPESRWQRMRDWVAKQIVEDMEPANA